MYFQGNLYCDVSAHDYDRRCASWSQKYYGPVRDTVSFLHLV